MALKVGDLYVSLTANTQKLQGQLNGAAKQVEKFGRQMKALGKDASEMSNMVMAAVGAAIAAASSKDATVKKQVDELKNQSTALAIEVARAALPVLQSMADFVGRLVTLFRQMTPEQRAMVTSFIAAAAGVTAIGSAVAKIAPLFTLLSTLITSFSASLAVANVSFIGLATTAGTFLLSLLPIIATIAVLVGAAGLMREAWDQNLGGIQEKAAAVWSWMQEGGGKLGKSLGKAASWVGEKFQKAFIWIAETFAGMAKKLLAGMAWLAKKMGLDSFVDVDGLQGFGNDIADWIAQLPTDAGLDSLKDDALNTLMMMKNGVVKIGGDIASKVKGIFGGLPDAAKAVPLKDISEKAEKAKTDFGRLRADKMDASFRALRGRGGNLRDSMEMAGALNVPAELEKFNGEALSSIKGIEDVRDFLHKLGASAGETEKYLSEWQKWREKLDQDAKHVERLRADRAPQAAEQFLSGGTFGESARLAGVKTGVPEWLEKLNGSNLKSLSDFEDLEDALAQIRDLNPVVKEFFETSKKTFTDGIEKAKQQAEELMQARSQAVSGFRDQVIGTMGKVGGIIQAATGPLAQALGPIGALLGIVLELVSGSRGFTNLIAALDGILQGLADAVGQVFEPVSMLINAVQPIVGAVGALVAQVLPLVTSVLEPLLPVFVMLGAVLMALSPLLAFVVRVVEVVLIPVLAVLEGAMRALFGALQTVAVIVLGVVVGVVMVWNGVISAIQAVLSWISGFEIAGVRPFAFLADWATSLEAAKGPAAQYQQQLNDTMAMTYESAMTQAKAFGALDEATNKLAGSMTNAASGFKVDLARFNATSAGPALRAPMDDTGAGYYGDTFVTIVSNDPEVIWEKVEGVRRRKNFQSGRGLLGGLPAYGG